MPWRVVKDEESCPVNKPWAVKNTVTGTVNGRCHATKAKAVDQQRAMYANVPEAKRMSEQPSSYLKRFSDVSLEWIDGNKLWIQIYPFDSWDHPMFSETTVDPEIAQALKQSFDNHVYSDEYAVSYNHQMDKAKGSKAAGWYRQLEVRRDQADPAYDGLWGLVEYTDVAKAEIEAGEWKYHSGEHYDQWIHPQTQEVHEYVFRGGAVTNSPWVKGMIPMNFSELVVEMASLPDDVRSTVQNGGNMSEVVDEHADKEHADPGQEVRTDESTINDPDTGSRVDTPPDLPDTEDSVRVRELLGLDAEGSIEDAVESLIAEVTPIREAAKMHSEHKSFSEMFPEQARELAESRKERMELKAKAFSESFVHLKDAEGKDTGKGLPPVVIEKLSAFHKSFSEGKATIDDVADILSEVTSGGTVEYGERGSSKPLSDLIEAGPKQFSELVTKYMDDDELDLDAATKMVMDKHPDAYQAYRESIPGRRK